LVRLEKTSVKGDSMLIGKINDKKHQKLLVTLREIKGLTYIDFRVHSVGTDGEFLATPAGLSLSVEQTAQAIDLLAEAKKKVIEQG
jgi:hypothetical protein